LSVAFHCSRPINDTLINRIPHCQNVFTKLINVLDLTLVQDYVPLLSKFISIPCTKNYHHYYLQANYLYEFLEVQWLHFTDVVDKVISAHFQFFSGFYIPKNR